MWEKLRTASLNLNFTGSYNKSLCIFILNFLFIQALQIITKLEL